MKRSALLGAVLLGLACGRPPPAPEDAGPCASYGTPERTGYNPAVLPELSGLAASRKHPGIFWAHNDSGNALKLFALTVLGEVKAELTLTGPLAEDPEDIAVAPCAEDAARSCIYLGDTGDNLAQRASVQVLVVEEPDALVSASVPATALPFVYPGGPRDAEVLLADPRTGALFVASKTYASLGDVFAVPPASAPAMSAAVQVGSLVAPWDADRLSTAGDVHPAGERLLIRSYGVAWEWRAPGARSIPELLGGEVFRVPAPAQPQAEAVAYEADGAGYVLGSEGAGEGLFRARCR